MKKTLFITFSLLLLCVSAMAQMQNGYVRSQGTFYNRTGTPLQGARVFVKGLHGAKVTAPDGTFNINLGGGKTQFSISNVSLQGYTLLTPLAPAYNVGSVAVEIVMQSRAERIQNEARISKAIEERITESYRARTCELQKKIADLEKALSDKNKNQEELEGHIRSLKEQYANLDTQYLKRSELIDRMVEEYVNLDYATMDSCKAELCSYIESGELEKADSLLNTIDIIKVEDEIKALDQDIEEKESMLAKEIEIRKHKIETACMYWRGKYDVAVQNMQYDSAVVYIRHLADVDTCNHENVLKCADFLCEQNRFKDAESYYVKNINNLKQGCSSHEQALMAGSCNNLANLYKVTQQYQASEELHKQAMAIREQLAKDNPELYLPDLAASYNNLANLYRNTQQYQASEELHKQSMAIREQLAKDNPEVYRPALAVSYNDLAILYSDTQQYQASEKLYKQAMAIHEQLAKDNPEVYRPHLATSYSNLAELYRITHRYQDSEELYKQAIAILEQLAKDNPEVYRPNLAQSYNNLAILYGYTYRYQDSEEQYKQAIALREQLAKDNPEVYRPALAESYNNLSVLYRITHRYQDSEEQHKQAMAIHEQLAKDNPEVYRPHLATSYSNLADLYRITHRYQDSEEQYKQAIALREQLAKDNPEVYRPHLAASYSNLAELYRITHRYQDSEELYKQAIAIFEQLAKDNPEVYRSALAQSYNNLALLYSDTQQYQASEELHKQAMAIREQLAKDNPEVYRPALAQSYHNLAILYFDTHRYQDSEEMYKSVIPIYERLCESNPQHYQRDLAEVYHYYAMSMINLDTYHDAIIPLERSLKLCKEMMKEESDTSLYVSNLYYLTLICSNEKDYTTAYAYNNELLPLIKANFEENSEGWRKEYNGIAISQSFNANLLGKFKEGEQYSLEALRADSTRHVAYTNLAAALLFRGRTEEAEKLYREYKEEFKQVFLDDFAEYERLGVIPKARKADVERIKAMLNE